MTRFKVLLYLLNKNIFFWKRRLSIFRLLITFVVFNLHFLPNLIHLPEKDVCTFSCCSKFIFSTAYKMSALFYGFIQCKKKQDTLALAFLQFLFVFFLWLICICNNSHINSRKDHHYHEADDNDGTDVDTNVYVCPSDSWLFWCIWHFTGL